MSDSRPPSLRQLRIFEAVARLKSFNAAANEVHLSQPAVTQSIRNLEGRLATRLFLRTSTGSHLTTGGRLFLARTERVLSQIQQALLEPIVGPAFADSRSTTTLAHQITDAHVRSLIAISGSASFDEAARRLGISEPSLHRAARMLERILRRTLYRRTDQGFTTTAAAAELARRFSVAMREIEYGIDEIRAEQGRFISRLVVGNVPHSDVQSLATAISKLLSAFPDVAVRVIDGPYNDLLTGLRNGRIDLLYGVLRVPEWATDVEERYLFKNFYKVVGRVGHPISAASRVTVAQLAQFEWIMPPVGTPRRNAFENIFRRSGKQPKVRIETTSMDIYRTALRSSDRLALFSQRESQSDATTGLAIVPFQSPHLQRQDGLVTRREWRPTRVHVELLDQLNRLTNDG